MDAHVVWNLDARHRPELEVEIDIIYAPHEIPGRDLARHAVELEVEMSLVTDSLDEEAWFVSDDDVELLAI